MNKPGVDSVRVAHPLFQAEGDGSKPVSTLQLTYEKCSRKYAARLNKLWHSRLPNIEWMTTSFAFHARYADVSYACAIWSHPVTNMLPSYWLELRRLAIAPDAPRFTASSFLSWMVRYFKKYHPNAIKLISYQDTSVHCGTIYKASGWHCVGKTHQGGKCGWSNNVRIRAELNGIEPLESIKHRWEIDIAPRGKRAARVIAEEGK